MFFIAFGSFYLPVIEHVTLVKSQNLTDSRGRKYSWF